MIAAIWLLDRKWRNCTSAATAVVAITTNVPMEAAVLQASSDMKIPRIASKVPARAAEVLCEPIISPKLPDERYLVHSRLIRKFGGLTLYCGLLVSFFSVAASNVTMSFTGLSAVSNGIWMNCC